MTNTKIPRVLIIQSPSGEYEIMQSHGVDVFFVSDHTPYDRVYKWSTFNADAQIDAVLGDSPHGHIDDSSAAQIRAHRAAKIIDGGCHLSTAENGDKNEH